MLNDSVIRTDPGGMAEVLGLLLAWAIILFVIFNLALAMAYVQQSQKAWKIRRRARRIRKIRERSNEADV